jgi:RND superfamily putative drug exporter
LFPSGVSIDYSLFIILRFREDRTAFPEAPVVEAVDRVIATSGRTVMFSAITVALSLTGTFFFHEYYIYSMGLGIIYVVCVASLASLSILMTILIHFDLRLFRWSTDAIVASIQRKFSSAKATSLTQDDALKTPVRMEDGKWYRMTILSMKYAVPICILIIGGLSALLYVFVAEAEFGSPSVYILPKSSKVRYVYDTVSHSFSATGMTSLEIYLETLDNGGVWTPEFLTSLDEFASTIETHDNVASIQCIVRVGDPKPIADYITYYTPALNGNFSEVNELYDPYFLTDLDRIARVSVALNSSLYGSASKNMVKLARKLLSEMFIDSNGDPLLSASGVTGQTAQSYDLYLDIGNELPKWFGVMVSSIFLLLTIMTASVILPFKAIATALLSLCATLGVLVFIFQQGKGQDLLDFTATGTIDGQQLIFIFSLAFGLSMDYELFILG